MEIGKTKRTLKIIAERYVKRGYGGDAANYAFKRHTLILIEKVR